MKRVTCERDSDRPAPSWLRLAPSGFQAWWTGRHGPRPPAGDTDTGARPSSSRGRRTGRPGPEPLAVAGGAPSALWRMRATVRDEPGSLAALCARLAGLGVDIVSLQTHPLADGVVDEFLLRAPGGVTAAELAAEVQRAGGWDVWTERGDAHDLVDAPTRAVTLATRTALDPAELPLALRQLLGRCAIRQAPPGRGGGSGEQQAGAAELDEDSGTVMRLPTPDGGVITVDRPHLPFTPAEFARARALVELDGRLGPRLPVSEDLLTVSGAGHFTVRRAGPGDLEAAKALHTRCSPQTLRRRYHGPVGDADRYLRHLLSPNFGRTLVVETTRGHVVGLGHLLWDGDETEVALLVEDAWQRRGIGGELLYRLVRMAAEAGCGAVYAVTQASNTGMLAAMRGLELPLEYQVEEGTLVITARVEPVPAALPQCGAVSDQGRADGS
ncbi:GNAT family N-acetyltransferase [Streptomyces abyssomicinicus]|uniref:GNAT family N-acetyltransferase n=1 Tax=Streptomyces abyssomicinicus TaxID=574929 RepID=UPI001250956A|nr:GNAT family N-acetyltransferase [Streptomyces abyssomicinicus]